MGSPEREWGRDDDEGPQRELMVRSFLLGRYPVTNAEYERYLESHPRARRPETLDDPRFNAPQQPLVCVSWFEAKQFAAWVGGRLPTEAEWEYACRAGTKTSTYAGETSDNDPRLDAVAWHQYNSESRTQVVGQKLPNDWGLYDILGNVWEWCADWYEPYPPFPRGTGGSERVVRGGCWINRPRYARAARRDEMAPELADERVGFRVAQDL
jgi:formylglycine-generating enzyme required for sulfatase activity